MYLLMTEKGKNSYKDVAISSKCASVQNPGSTVLTRHLKTGLKSNHANWNLLLRSPKNLQFCSWVTIDSTVKTKRQYYIETLDILL